MTTTTGPVAGARELALAHYAARAVLERVLARHGMTFQEQVALRAAVSADAPQTSDVLVTRVQHSLKAGPTDVRSTLGELLTKRLLVEEGPHIRPTDAGRELMAAVGAETAPLSARIWSGMSESDLATFGRVLALVTERADAELRELV
ncbi:MarR family transcriptional regulator [Streptomyces griseoluteus]|uniref:MarR family transcriptional regulator n=1 Tax=Streptomyces griseoluteus TaxID=29306 RepID=UPI0036B616B4